MEEGQIEYVKEIMYFNDWIEIEGGAWIDPINEHAHYLPVEDIVKIFGPTMMLPDGSMGLTLEKT